MGIRQGGVRLGRAPKPAKNILNANVPLVLIQSFLQARREGPGAVVLTLVVFSATGVGEDFTIVGTVYGAP